MLGFTGNAAADVFTAWSRIAAQTYERKERLKSSSAHSSPVICGGPLRRTSSLNTVSRTPKTVRRPVDLIPLEKARARTMTVNISSDSASSLERLEASVMKMSLEQSQKMTESDQHLLETGIKISPPLHLEDEFTSSYPGLISSSTAPHRLPYAPRTDNSPSYDVHRLSMVEEESSEISASNDFDMCSAIQKYLEKVSV